MDTSAKTNWSIAHARAARNLYLKFPMRITLANPRFSNPRFSNPRFFNFFRCPLSRIPSRLKVNPFVSRIPWGILHASNHMRKLLNLKILLTLRNHNLLYYHRDILLLPLILIEDRSKRNILHKKLVLFVLRIISSFFLSSSLRRQIIPNLLCKIFHLSFERRHHFSSVSGGIAFKYSAVQ